MNEICGDNRFEIIAKAKAHLLDATNIDTSEDEMKVLDSFLFRCWQMGWLDRYDDRKTENSSEKPNNCEDEPTWEQVKEYCNKRCLDIVDSAMRKQWYRDEPQTEDKHAVCKGCDYYDLPNAFHPCASCVDFSKYKSKIEDEPQAERRK